MNGYKFLVGVALIALVLLAGCDSGPEAYARAGQINVATEATATAAAVDARARATTSAGQAQATATIAALSAQATGTAMVQQAQATQTAVPWQAPRVGAAVSNEIAQDWALTFGLFGFLIVAFLFGCALVYFTRNRAEQMPRDASGQLPGVLKDGVVTDPQRMIGPSIALPRQPDKLWQLARVVRYLTTGKVEPLPEPQFALTDGGADADHLLAAAQSANQVTGIAAMFRPDNVNRGRGDKIEILKRDAGKGLLGSGLGAAPPTTRVLVQGDSAIRQIAEQLGHRLPLPAPAGANEPTIIDSDGNSVSGIDGLAGALGAAGASD